MADKWITVSLKLENGAVTQWVGKAATKAAAEQEALEHNDGATVVSSALVKA
jgi:hypothetical protein